ncbi:MAG: DNA topoisomerase IB [Myxococcota bacterium]
MQDAPPPIAVPDGPASAARAGLRYVSDDEPGLTRRRRGKGFSYHRPDGSTVGGEDRARCAALVIPPAWTEVWICATPDGHLQATGRDAKGRKQYRYHDDWLHVRQMVKYQRLQAFGRALPALREQVEAALRKRGLPREKVLAAVVAVMDRTLLRVGNAEYARDNDSYGLTTLRSDHVEVHGAEVAFRFRGKSGKTQDVSLKDRRIAKIVRACQELRGQELFGYLDDDDEPRDVRSEDVNGWLHDTTGQPFTAKDFRTWGGSVRCFRLLREAGAIDDERARKKAVTAAIKCVAARLGNTAAVCRSYYVHPVVLSAFDSGSLFEVDLDHTEVDGLGASEQGLLWLLAELEAAETLAG